LGFTAVAVPTLALGIGAATAIFSVVKVVILNPLPFHQPENLVHVWEGHEHYHHGDQAYFSTARPASLYDWRAQSRSFESITAYRWRPMLLTDDKRPELVSAQDVCDQFFETLGTPAHLGRTLEAPDYEPSAAHVVVIGNAMWVNRLGADPRVIGRRISLTRESYEIVGVMPSGFYPAPNNRELWTPHLALQAEKDAQNVWGLFSLARLNLESPGSKCRRSWTSFSASLAGSPNLGIGWWDRRSHGCAIRPLRNSYCISHARAGTESLRTV